MHTNKSFYYRIYPTDAQLWRIRQWDGALRCLWNVANEQRRMGLARSKEERIYVSAIDQQLELTELRENVPWLADVPRDVCAQLLIELDKAWQRCFKKLAKRPRWKKYGRDHLSLTESHHRKWRLDGTILRFPKLGNIRTVVHRPLEGKPKTCTIKRDGDQWFACITCEIEIDPPAPKTEPVVGIDRGVINTVADSDGTLVPSPHYFEKSRKQLARAQRAVERKVKGSKNQIKAKRRVMRVQRKVRRQREHFIHQLSHDYSKSHGVVVIEDLQIGNMVRANRGLARNILDQGWGMLAQFLKYKLTWEGGTLGEVNPSYSSQTCSECGHVDSKSRKGESFCCTRCGHTEHADTNAAKIIKSRWRPSVQPAESSCRLRTPRRRRKVEQVLLEPQPQDPVLEWPVSLHETPPSTL
jgi:putative transposase